MRLGVIGAGHLAGALLEGLHRSGFPADMILLSPRGRAAAFAQRWGFTIAASNEALVRECDVVLLTVRSGVATAAVADLPWRRGQVLLSACAGVPIAEFAMVKARTVRIMPITAASLGASPTLLFPHEPEAAQLMARLGPVVELDTEQQFEIATTSAAIYGWAQQLIRASADWSAAQGLDARKARQINALTFVAAGRMVNESTAPMKTLIESLATPGGITEAGLDHLREAGALDAWEEACDTVLARLTSRR